MLPNACGQLADVLLRAEIAARSDSTNADWAHLVGRLPSFEDQEPRRDVQRAVADEIARAREGLGSEVTLESSRFDVAGLHASFALPRLIPVKQIQFRLIGVLCHGMTQRSIANVIPHEQQLWKEIKDRLVVLRREQEIARVHKEQLEVLREHAARDHERERSRLAKIHARERQTLQNKIRRVGVELDEVDERVLIRELNIPSEYHNAGVTILQGFVRLLRDRYAGQQLTTSIRQDETKLTLVVETSDGLKEEVSEYLDHYGDVVMGRAPIESVTPSPIVAMELRHQLDIARLQVQTQREINYLQQLNHEERIRSLEQREEWMQQQIGFAMTSISQELNAVIQLVGDRSSLGSALFQVQGILEKPDSKAEKKTLVSKVLEKVTTDGVAPGAAEAVKSLIAKLCTLVGL